MIEKLNLINVLISEIDQLTETKDRLKSELDKCSSEILNTLQSVNDIKFRMENNIEYFEKEWHKRFGILISPFYCVLWMFLGIGLMNELTYEYGNNFIIYFISFASTGLVTYANYYSNFKIYDIYYNYPDDNNLSSKYYRYFIDKLRSFLFKKYPHIEDTYNKLLMLEDEIINKEEQIEQLNINKSELENKYENVCNLLNKKNDELINLKVEYFDYLVNNYTEKKENKEIVSDNLIKRKTKLRLPENN